MQFLAWDTFARRRVDMIGRKDKGDTVIAHEFDYRIEKQVNACLACSYCVSSSAFFNVSPPSLGLHKRNAVHSDGVLRILYSILGDSTCSKASFLTCQSVQRIDVPSGYTMAQALRLVH